MNKWVFFWLLFVAGWYLIPWWNKVYFLWDDIELLLRFRHPVIETFLSSHQYQFFPVFKLLYWAETKLFGVNPAAFLAVSVTLHLINIYLVYSLIKKLTSDQTLSLISAFLVGFNKSFFSVIFWPTIQSNLILTTFLLIAFHLFFDLKNKFQNSTLFLFAAAIILTGLSFGFGIGAGFVFAAVAIVLWKKPSAYFPVSAASVAAGLIPVLSIFLFSTYEIQKDQVFQFSLSRIFNIVYFTFVGISQAVISRFLLPGFIPNIYSPINIVVMIAIPTLVLLFFALVTIKNRRNYDKLAPLFLFGTFIVIPYFIAALARSGSGALGGLAERYIYLPFFTFILAITYSCHLLTINTHGKTKRLKALLTCVLIIISLGHQATLYLALNQLFL